MKKYILISLIALLSHNAYGAFDFNNYVPTLTNLYYQGQEPLFKPSAYTLSFVLSENANNAVTTYSIGNNNSLLPVYYTYTYSYGPATYNTTGDINNGSVWADTQGSYIGIESGAISNIGTNAYMSAIYGDFVDNSAERYGAAIKNTGLISNITGDFVRNNTGNVGGAIFSNGVGIENITGNFIGNSTYYNGGAIYHSSGVINSVTGHFIDNKTTKFSRWYEEDYISDEYTGGGAIYNTSAINSITGDFIGNSSGYNGGAIYNNGGIIETITGNFINNKSYLSGGAIYNINQIENIIGDFIGNQAWWGDVHVAGGAIYNTGAINSITGDFIGNSSASGGAIYNNGGIIETITGNFINNVSPIYNANGTIETIMGDFICNEGGAINSGGTGAELAVSGNFQNNYGTNIYGVTIRNTSGNRRDDDNNLSNIVFLSNTESYIISDNYYLGTNDDRNDTAIISYGARTVFDNKNQTSYTVNDEIYFRENNIIDNDTNIFITSNTMEITGDGTGYTQFNNDIKLSNRVDEQGMSLIINNGKMVFGRTPNDYTGTQDFGHFVGTNITMNLNNGTFDIANGYTETVTLNGLSASDDNNFIHIDLDTSNKIADIISVQTSITGQINLVVNALWDLDINDNIIWFANANDATENSFILDSVDNLSYDLNIVFDSTNKQWGLQKVNTEPENPDDPNPNNPDTPDNPDTPNNPDVPGNPDTPDNPGNPDEPGNPDTPDTPDNPDTPDDPNPGNPDTPVTPNTPDTPEQPVVQNDPEPVLPKAVVQMVDYTTNTIKHTVQKLTNSMQKRVGELQWVASNAASDSQNAFWTRGIHKNFDAADTAVGLSGIEFGYDRIVSSSENYKFFIGGLGYIASGDSKFDTNTLDINGYGLGAYAMLLNKSGLFMDLVFRQHFIGIDAQSTETDYTATSLNMEIGKEFVFGTDEGKMKWFAKPSLEGTFIYTPKTKIGEFNIDSSTVKNASLTLLAGPRWGFQSETKFQAYGKVAYNLDASDNVSVIINNVNTKRSVFADTFEMGMGLDYRGTDNSTNVYFEASYITGTDYSEISGNLGLRYAF
ncbi:MAG: hypothetical protein K6B71_02565 [Alphaproteobacteria bacterium]|nr:hypothetical protein [Alphaproteobacteria bacterium]